MSLQTQISNRGNYGDVLSLLAIDLLSKNLIKSKIGVVGVREVFQILAVNTWFTNDSFMVHSWLAHEDAILDNQHRDYSTIELVGKYC
ncbi:hypothetical protein [Candidatus Nitrosocosmicus sp. R]